MSQPALSPLLTGTVTLINLIPYAGGAIASVIGEFAGQRRIEKICDVLAGLNAALEAHRVDPEKNLSKDQIVEVVYETLQTAATTSDGRKLDALKRGLAYTFLAEEPFERKQVFLQVLRAATTLELAVLQKVYGMSDPHIATEGAPLERPLGPASRSSINSVATVAVTHGAWQPIKNEERGAGTLLSALARETALDEGMAEGVLRLLDSKGLTSAALNLHRTDSKVVRWVPSAVGSSVMVMPSSGYSSNVVKPSPLEATLTKFGTEFLRFCRSDLS